MGQYYILVNVDKKEYCDPWSLGGIAKFWEWCTCSHAFVMPYLLALNDGSGGGDGEVEGKKYLGRWAGDRVFLVGDYWDSGKYAKLYRKVMDNDLDSLKEDIASLEKEIAGGYPYYMGDNKHTTFIPGEKKRLKQYQRRLTRLETLKAKNPARLWKNISLGVKAEFEAQAGKGALDLNHGVKPQMRPDMVLTAGPKPEEENSS